MRSCDSILLGLYLKFSHKGILPAFPLFFPFTSEAADDCRANLPSDVS